MPHFQVATSAPEGWPVGLTLATLMALPVLLAAIAGGLVAAVVAHGVLRPLLEARGVAPWRVRDSVGATPLVVIGSGTTSGAFVALVLLLVAPRVVDVHAGWGPLVLCLALLAVGVLTMRLGLLALRKLT